MAERAIGGVPTVVQLMFSSVWFVACAVILVIIPARGLAALRCEAGTNTELLLAARLSTWRIVGGKWLVLCAQGWLVLVSLLPYFIVRYFMGGMDIMANLVAIIYLIAGNATVTAICIGASGYPGNLARITVAVVALGATAVTAGGAAAGSLAAMQSGGITGLASWLFVVFVLATLTFFAVYCLLGLQLGRARLWSGRHAYAGEPSKEALALIIATPFILAAVSVATMAIGAPVVAIILIVAASRMNPERRTYHR